MVSLWHLPLLFATGLAAGFIDSIAGGGGLITLPVLMSFGLEPQHALGTNKLQAAFGSGSAAWHFSQAGLVTLQECKRGFVCALIGAALGTLVVQRIDPSFLKKAIPVLLIAIALYSLLKPRFGAADAPPRMSRPSFDVFFGLVLGFYDGFLGPGAGTFWTMAFAVGLGFNLTKATAHTKVVNFASNLSSLTFFVIAQKVLFLPGLAMGLGQLLGARLGSSIVIRKGTNFIRAVFIAVVLAITVKLIYDSW